MSIVSKALQKVRARKLLYAEIAFTMLAFFMMITLSYMFTSNIVSSDLMRYTKSVVDFAQSQIEADLSEPKLQLGSFAQSIRSLVIRGYGVEELQDYIGDQFSYIQEQGQAMDCDSDAFFYYEGLPGSPVLLKAANRELSFISDPDDLAWYKTALDAKGEVVETLPHVCDVTGVVGITHVRCIYDDEGRRLGVVGMDTRIKDFGSNIVGIALDKGGYGMILDQNNTIVAHANPEFVGLQLQDPNVPMSVYADEILAGDELTQFCFTNWAGEDTIAFFSKLPSGWYIGLLTPRGPFYQGVSHMMQILCVIGTSLGTVLIFILNGLDKKKNRSDAESKQKSVFLANMSHEIRTPMNAIIGMTSIGKTSPDIDGKDYCLTKIWDASNHLLGIINDILDMSKIEANKFELSPINFCFERMLQRVVNVVNFRVEEKQQKLSVYIDRRIPTSLHGDDQRLAQIVANILSNAVKFTPEKGSITLSANLLEKDETNCIIQIEVADTGIGMSREQQERLFNAFHQAESSTTRNYGGTGLGLSISKSIVELMHGTIEVESELGQGATFKVKVPLERGAEIARIYYNSNTKKDGYQILVVDHDPSTLLYLEELVLEYGLQCDTAKSAEEVKALVGRNGLYDVCFVDWQLLCVDGSAITKTLKDETGDQDTTIVAMISSAERRMIENDACRVGADRLLSKPVFPSDIMDELSEILGTKKLKASADQSDHEGVFEGRHILLVEDVEINREIVISLLASTHISIDCVENGVEAVQIFSKSPEKYDMILMDIQMPRMDGYEATRQIRALDVPNAGTIPVIALTANVFREDVERCLEAGMTSHLGKPLDYGEIMETLRKHMPTDKNPCIAS